MMVPGGREVLAGTASPSCGYGLDDLRAIVGLS
jgi:hypothetical protein